MPIPVPLNAKVSQIPVRLHFRVNDHNGSPCCPHRPQCPRLRAIPEAVPRSSWPDCGVSFEHFDWEKHLEMSRYLRRQEDKQVSLVCTHMQTVLRLEVNSTDVVPLLTVGVGATMAVGTTPSKPNGVKGEQNQTDRTAKLSRRTLLQRL